MIIVSDTTTISNLVQIYELEILKKLYVEVIIPVSVFDELQVLIETEMSLTAEHFLIQQIQCERMPE